MNYFNKCQSLVFESDRKKYLKSHRKRKCSSGTKIRKAQKIPAEAKEKIQKDLKKKLLQDSYTILVLKKGAFLLYENIQNLSLNVRGITTPAECRTEHSNFFWETWVL